MSTPKDHQYVSGTTKYSQQAQQQVGTGLPIQHQNNFQPAYDNQVFAHSSFYQQPLAPSISNQGFYAHQHNGLQSQHAGHLNQAQVAQHNYQQQQQQLPPQQQQQLPPQQHQQLPPQQNIPEDLLISFD